VLSGRIKPEDETPSQSVTAAVRRLASGELDRLATRIRPRRTWNDLVLPPDQLIQVRDVVSRYRHRTQVFDTWGFKPIPSAGVVAMFAGPPGTGKTLSAEVVAGELGLDLFRIDLATLVSKYIGETEKNLEKIFQAADGGTMVLLFDEADAVFGKRSEVKDANDKYANVETSYLLQRIESYDGVVVLTTNYVANIDEAFIRRIHVSVDFQLPDEAERLQMWTNSFPSAAPMGEVDLAFLARQFRLSGASIRSISLGAAFRAADDETPIGMESILTSLRVELRKQGRLTSSIDFGKYAHLGALRAASTPASR
jgi:SpoVK/Ycf46/Vps4 family AAA+-type ATPase